MPKKKPPTQVCAGRVTDVFRCDVAHTHKLGRFGAVDNCHASFACRLAALVCVCRRRTCESPTRARPRNQIAEGRHRALDARRAQTEVARANNLRARSIGSERSLKQSLACCCCCCLLIEPLGETMERALIGKLCVLARRRRRSAARRSGKLIIDSSERAGARPRVSHGRRRRHICARSRT